MITDQTAGIATCEIAASLEKAAGQEDRSQIIKAMLWSMIKTAAGGSPDCVKAGGKTGFCFQSLRNSNESLTFPWLWTGGRRNRKNSVYNKIRKETMLSCRRKWRLKRTEEADFRKTEFDSLKISAKTDSARVFLRSLRMTEYRFLSFCWKIVMNCLDKKGGISWRKD